MSSGEDKTILKLKQRQKETKQLKRELIRKEKTLTEAAAIPTLWKRLQG
ncbi:hypothetical protein [Xenorhabdus khoisanae]|nr:hypothetical protein [Xenorhabdus khoisanae]